MKAEDKQTGISIRFIQQYDIAKDQAPKRDDFFSSPTDAALFLAMNDGRDVPMSQKVADALEFMKSRLQSAEPVSHTEPTE